MRQLHHNSKVKYKENYLRGKEKISPYQQGLSTRYNLTNKIEAVV